MKKSNFNTKKKPKNHFKKKQENSDNKKNSEKSLNISNLQKPSKLIEEKVINFLEKMKNKKSDHLFSLNFKKDLKNWFPFLTPSSNINIDFNIYISKKEKIKKTEKNIFEKKIIKKESVKLLINNIVNKKEIIEKKKISNFEIFLPKAKRINFVKKRIIQKSKIQTFQDFLNFRINFEDTISDEIIKKDKYFFQINKLKNFWIKKENKTPFVFKRQNISDNNCISEIIDFSQKIA